MASLHLSLFFTSSVIPRSSPPAICNFPIVMQARPSLDGPHTASATNCILLAWRISAGDRQF